MFTVIAYRPNNGALTSSAFDLKTCHSLIALERLVEGFYLQNLQHPHRPAWELTILRRGEPVLLRDAVTRQVDTHCITLRTTLAQARSKAALAFHQWVVDQDEARRVAEALARDSALKAEKEAEWQEFQRLRQLFEPGGGTNVGG